MKTYILEHKKKMTLIIAIIFVAWFFGSYIPQQNCLSSIRLKYNDASSYNYDRAYFKTMNDALDYCMAERWSFLK